MTAPAGIASPPFAAAVQRTDEELDRLHRCYRLTGDARLRTELIIHYDPLAVRLGRTFTTRRETADDLIQVARLALIHAVDRFDPQRERPFVPFATTTIRGELKRHLRDRTWPIRPPRRVQESYLLVIRTIDDLTHELGRSPTLTEIAGRAGLGEDDVLEAIDVIRSSPVSLDQPVDDDLPMDVGQADAGFGRVENQLLYRTVLGSLTVQERRILRLRFEEGLSQSEIGARVGRSQMYVSRVLARTLRRLRPRLADGPAMPPGPNRRTRQRAVGAAAGSQP
ncbi:MAG: sigma-70 family RNA polymerase sigma factor [Actinomycetota bacterium]|jgi:RNA polymerase sigma-B factor